MLNLTKNTIQRIRRSILFPTNNGGWPFIPWADHQNAARIWRIFLNNRQQFGRNTLYQSFEPLGLPGLRPTRDRIDTYKISSFTNPNSRILDIGSNMGCTALTLALDGFYVTGVEFNEILTKISNLLKSYVDEQKATFINADFSTWKCDEKFDVVLALAVHRWVPMKFRDFAERVTSLLNTEGVLVFESNNYDVLGEDFEREISIFQELGFEILDDGFVYDDTRRKYVVFRKAS